MHVEYYTSSIKWEWERESGAFVTREGSKINVQPFRNVPNTGICISRARAVSQAWIKLQSVGFSIKITEYTHTECVPAWNCRPEKQWNASQFLPRPIDITLFINWCKCERTRARSVDKRAKWNSISVTLNGTACYTLYLFLPLSLSLSLVFCAVTFNSLQQNVVLKLVLVT